jgi:hypothetical protein
MMPAASEATCALDALREEDFLFADFFSKVTPISFCYNGFFAGVPAFLGYCFGVVPFFVRITSSRAP